MLRAVSPIPSQVTKYWGFFTLSANQTTGLSIGSPVRFNVRNNGNIDLTNYQMTLPVAGTYSLDCVFRLHGPNSSTGQLNCYWYDVGNGDFVGISGIGFTNTASTVSSQQPTCSALITVENPTVLEVRITNNVNTSLIHSGFTRAQIIQIA